MGIQTTLCYMEKDDAYLMLHRVKKQGDINHGKWIGIGGKFEADESPEECMMREVEEETGLIAREWSYRGLVTFVSANCETEYMHLFTIRAWTGDMRQCDEGVLEWVEKTRLMELEHWKGDEAFLSLIADPDTPFFSLKLVYDEDDELIEAALDGVALDVEDWNWL